MSEPPSIASSLARIDRANENIRNLERVFRTFIDRDAYEVVGESDIESHVHTYTVVRVHDVPMPLRVLVGEIAHHLRAAFDLLVYQLMLHAKVTDKKRLSRCAFPIIEKWDLVNPKKRKEYEAMMSGKIDGIGPRPRTRIEDLQPCITGDGDRSFLAQIDSLDNTDKHRLLLAVVSSLPIGHARYNDGTNPPIVIARGTYIALDPGTTIKRGPTPPEMDVDLKKLPWPVEITFGESGVLWNKPVVPTLQNLSDLARKTIRLFDGDFG